MIFPQTISSPKTNLETLAQAHPFTVSDRWKIFQSADQYLCLLVFRVVLVQG